MGLTYVYGTIMGLLSISSFDKILFEVLEIIIIHVQSMSFGWKKYITFSKFQWFKIILVNMLSFIRYVYKNQVICQCYKEVLSIRILGVYLKL